MSDEPAVDLLNDLAGSEGTERGFPSEEMGFQFVERVFYFPPQYFSDKD